jgi:hypothetical protein
MRAFGHFSGTPEEHRASTVELGVSLRRKIKKFSQEKNRAKKILRATHILIGWGKYEQSFGWSNMDMYPGGRDAVEFEDLLIEVRAVWMFLLNSTRS